MCDRSYMAWYYLLSHGAMRTAAMLSKEKRRIEVEQES